MRIRVAFGGGRNPIVITLCLACAATVAALSPGGSSARVSPSPAQSVADPAPVSGVVLESVTPGEMPGLVFANLKNVSDKPVAAVCYGRVLDGGVTSDASVIAVPDPIPPGYTYARRVPEEATREYGVKCVIYQDGTVEGSGRLAFSQVSNYNAAVR